MRFGLTGAIAAVLLLLPPAASAQTAEKAMTVFITAAAVVDTPKVDKATETKLRAAIKEVDQKRKDLEKQLKAKHGKKQEDWPLEAQDQYYDAEEAVALAVADWEYRRVKQAGLNDSVEDLKKSITGDGMAGKKENITIVDSRDAAQLVVEINGRRSAYSGQTGGLLAIRDDQYWISFLISSGPKLNAEGFASIPTNYRLRKFGARAWRLAIPRPGSPVWRFEAYGDTRWGAAANTASVLLEDFIAKNYERIAGAGTAR